MKVTQHMIDQASVIANAKVGDELEESIGGGQFHENIKGAVCLHHAYTYRIKPQPRTVWANESNKGDLAGHTYTSSDAAKAAAERLGLQFERIAVEYREVVK